MMNKTFTAALAATLAMALIGASVAEAREGRVRARGDKGVVTGVAGPNGGAAVRGRGAVQNSDGSVTSGSAAAVRTP